MGKVIDVSISMYVEVVLTSDFALEGTTGLPDASSK
jgi:hypothetical protein